MSTQEAEQFFTATFESAHVACDKDAAIHMAHCSAGFPKMMQMIGESAYWADGDAHIDRADAANAVSQAAQEVGRKYVDQQVLKALRSPDYRSILNKIGSRGSDEMTFNKTAVERDLSASERGKFNNFLQK